MKALRRVVLVTGGRDYRSPRERSHVWRVLDEVQPTLVLHGASRGADQAAQDWCRTRGVHDAAVAALWVRTGGKKSAGPIRNGVMVEMAKALGASVIAFPGGSGTADCVAQARAAGLNVREEKREEQR